MKVTLFMPTLNEIEGVKQIMPRVKKEWFDEVIVVDGHSTDGTPEYLAAQGYTVLQQEGKGGLDAWWQGFQASSGDIIIAFSPDGNSIPELIPVLIEKMNQGYDMVQVSRYKDGARSQDDDVMSGLGNWFFSSIINLLYGSRYTDVLVIFRAFRRDCIDRLKLTKDSGVEYNPKRYGMYELLLCVRCAKYNLRVEEIPGDEPHNIGRVESRAFKNNFAKVKAAFTMLYHILSERFTP